MAWDPSGNKSQLSAATDHPHPPTGTGMGTTYHLMDLGASWPTPSFLRPTEKGMSTSTMMRPGLLGTTRVWAGDQFSRWATEDHKEWGLAKVPELGSRTWVLCYRSLRDCWAISLFQVQTSYRWQPTNLAMCSGYSTPRLLRPLCPLSTPSATH